MKFVTLSLLLVLLVAFSATLPIYANAVGPDANQQYYFTSSSVTVNNVTAYSLGTDYSNTVLNITTSAAASTSVTYGYRIWVVTSSASTEITGGTPVAQTVLNSNTSAYQSATYTPTLRSLAVGTAIKVVVYLKINSGSFSAIGSFITEPLMATQILPTTWTFKSYLVYVVGASTSFLSSTSSYKAGLTGVSLTAASWDDIESFNFLSGNYIQGILYVYGSGLGVYGNFAIYTIEIITACAVLYLRNKSTGPVALFLVLFTASGVPIWAFLPGIVGNLVLAFDGVAIALIIWKIFR